MDPPPGAFELVANDFGVTQLEWDSSALTAESLGLPTIKLTWNLDGVTTMTPVEQLSLVSIINVVLHERTPFSAFCAGEWLDHLPNQLTTGYMNECMHQKQVPLLIIDGLGGFRPLLAAYCCGHPTLEFSHSTPTYMHAVWLSHVLANSNKLPTCITGLGSGEVDIAPWSYSSLTRSVAGLGLCTLPSLCSFLSHLQR